MKLYTYEDAFNYIGIPITNGVKEMIKSLNEEGYSEKCIAFTIAKGYDKIMSFKGDNRFWSILTNEIRKHAFKSNFSYKCKYFE